MGLITKEVEIKLNSNSVKHYENLGYDIPKYYNKNNKKFLVKKGTKIIVKVEDLTNRSNVLVEVKCDCEECKNPYLKPMTWSNYKRHIQQDKYYCKDCAINLYGNKNRKETILNKGLTFKQWAINYIDKDFMVKYWSVKNNEYGINAEDITYKSRNYLWIKCQNKSYHEDYYISCSAFVRGDRCPYCSNSHGKVHPLDSVGVLYPQVLEIWSDKNKKSAFEYAPMSSEKVYWKCLDGHEDYPRSIKNSNTYNFRCPECSYSKGEERISNIFLDKGFIKIDQNDFIKLVNKDKYNKNYYIPQMKYEGLVGVGNGLLSYDFCIPKHNLLIEYDGEYHYKPIKKYKNEPIKYAEERFREQQEHDRRKNEYAKINNINLLRIPYWDFDNIESILSEELNLTNPLDLTIPINSINTPEVMII